MYKSFFKWRFLLVAIAASLLFFKAQAQEEGAKGISFFHGSFAELKAGAASSGKPIFIDAYTSWCGPCKWMSKTVFTTEEAGTFYNEKFICAKIDMEKGEGVDIAQRYQVTAYPTLLFLNAEGELIHLAVGALPAPQFVELGKQALDPNRNMKGLQTRFEQNPGSFQAAYPYFSFLSESGIPALTQAVDNWFRVQPKAEWTAPNNWRILHDFVEQPENPAMKNLVEARAEFSKRYSADSVDEKLRKTYLMHLQRAAYEGNMDAWRSDSSDISKLKIKDGDRFIVMSKIAMAGDDISLALKRVMDYMNRFPSENPDELNNYAWKMYESSTDPKQLAAAEGWAKKGLDLSKGAYMIHDTYASLLFKNKKYALAKAEAAKAIERGKKDGEDVSGTENLLAEIDQAMAETKKPAAKPSPKKKK